MKTIFLFIIIVLILDSCSNGQINGIRKVLISTNYGDITVELFDETPIHRDNFIKLVEEGFYKGLLFHRVINSFMIQGGDPNSRGAEAGKRLGNGGPGYQLPAEFVSKYYHKKGALAAARPGDQVNPEKKSNGSQFYIVVGTVFSSEQLDIIEVRTNGLLQQKILDSYLNEAQNELNDFKLKNDEAGYNKKYIEIKARADSAYIVAPKFKISEEARKDYMTIGGYPSLDGAYTVFGQVIKGQEVADKISTLERDMYDRPVNEVIMNMKLIN